MNEKLILIGAGSAGFTRGLVSDIIRRGWEGEIGLVDIDPVALEVAEKMTRKMLDQKGSSLKLSASTDRRDVLTDATSREPRGGFAIEISGADGNRRTVRVSSELKLRRTQGKSFQC